MNKKDIYVGMKVKVFDVNSRRTGQPDSGWDGVVTAVRRTKCDIDYGDPKQYAFDIERQRIEDGYGHRYFKTLEEADRDSRYSAAKEVILASGLGKGDLTQIPLVKLEAIAALLGEE